MTSYIARNTRLSAAACAFLLFAAGCESNAALPGGQTAVSASPSSTPGATTEPTSSPPTPEPSSSSASSVQPSVSPGKTANDTQSLANAVTGSGVDAPLNAQRETNWPQPQPYTSAKPLLMGLSLADTKATVTAAYGKPAAEFEMNDDSNDPLRVFDYEAFSVGFGQNGYLRFIDIASASLDPGLNGVKLGQPGDEAIRLLGNPDIKTNYVIAYTTATTVLKLDIDPKSKRIQSIKLFGTDELGS
ncbi:MAG: DUF4309 domain-containing protein [Paenibacillaceae bacterium]|nr:DUF4309 domain-containing protein [Paenibacillaceae bacterium]